MWPKWFWIVWQGTRIKVTAKNLSSFFRQWSMAEATVFARVALGVGVKELAWKFLVHKETINTFACNKIKQINEFIFSNLKVTLTTKPLKVKLAELFPLGNWAIM